MSGQETNMEAQNIDYQDNAIIDLSNKTTDIRKAVIPLFDALIEKINKQPAEHNIKIVDTLIKYIGEKLDAIRGNVQKVEVTNVKQPIINVVEKQIAFPDVQHVTGQVEVKKIRDLQKAIDNLTEVIIAKDTPKFPYKRNEKIPVKIMEMPVFEQASNAGRTHNEEKIWLREEYDYTTISGTRVPTTIRKWDDDKKVTENYTYEVATIGTETIVSPISKVRSIEMI
jgi:hypothetical protein